MKRLCVIALLWVLGLPALLARADNPKTVLEPDQPYQGARSDPITYQVDLQFVVTPPYHAKTLKVWVPLPPSNETQEVSGRELSTFPLKVPPKNAGWIRLSRRG